MKRPALAKRLRFWALMLLFLGAAAGAGTYFYRGYGVHAAGKLVSAPVRQGDFLVIVRCRGELKAHRSVLISAPMNVPSLRIVWLAPPSGPVKAGDPVVRFDPSSARQQLQEKEAGLKQAQATLDQAFAQARITAEQDRRDLANSRYTVKRAELEASKAEIVSKLQGEESRIDLGLAQQNLKVQEATVALHQASDKAKVASLTSAVEKAGAEVALTKHRIEQMEVKAPGSGIVIYLPNYSQGWVNAKQFKVGDQVWPGAALGELPDLTTLHMEARVEEMDRARIALGCEARVRVDSLPELNILAKVDSISPLTSLNMADFRGNRSFVTFVQLKDGDQRLRPGMNGSVDVVVNRIPNALSIPAKALFTHGGKPIVYLADKGRYRAAEVEVLARNPDEVAIKGIGPGAMVTLTEPEQKDRKQ
jgi:multidrug efflux pump subunit AcrA (membrane-fusion protein)